MKIKKMSLQHIKSFGEEVSAEFGDEAINALSGVNGAGKSTLLKMIWLTQKAHYIFQQFSDVEMCDLQVELLRFLVRKNSFFALTIIFEEQELELKLSRTKDESNVTLTYNNKKLTNEMWNRAAPKNLILFVDASKGFSEDTLAFDEIDIAGNDQTSLIMSAILNPGKLFSGIYRCQDPYGYIRV